MNSQDSGSVRD